jgi:ribosomal protein S5
MSFFRQSRRGVHVGHIKSTLRKLESPIPQWLRHVDQAPTRSVIRREKDKYAKEVLAEKQNISALFGENEQASLGSSSSTSSPGVVNESREDKKKKISEALRMYRILQPGGLPFYKQDAMMSMKTKLNQLTNEHSGIKFDETPISPIGDPFQLQLPVINPSSFIIALEAATRSLADDLEYLCADFLGIDEVSLPDKNHPERFLLLVRQVFNAFPLRKDPGYVDQFMIDSWPRLKRLLPEGLSLTDQDVADWLRSHLGRVIVNQRGSNLSRNEWYNIAVDFKFDDFLNPRSVGGQRQIDTTKIGEQFGQILRALKVDELTVSDITAQLQSFIYDCEKIGLKSWIEQRDIDGLFDQHLPRGPTVSMDPASIRPNDIETARLLLRCAARGKPNLLDFDAIDPNKLLHGFPTKSVQEEIQMYEENPFMSDDDIDRLIDTDLAIKSLGQRPVESTGEITPLEEVVKAESEFAKNAGPAEWENGEWKWKKPSAAMFDPRLGKYVRNQSLVDPNLNLASFRQYTCDVRRMCSMSSAGRVYYARSIVVVGNGQGIYGFGVGFGNTPRESNADAAVKALRNLRYVDYDPTRTLTTPVRGSEYKARLFLRPLRQGKKLRAGRRFLPIFYILGLHNVRARFNHTGWFPRINAVIRTLDQIQSRRTLANATGKKYADITAPGDHWVHWPDRWFDVIRRTYQNKEQRIKAERRRVLHHRKRGHVMASPMEVRPGWTKYAWMNPLAKWNKEVGRSRTIARTVKQLPVSDHFPTAIGTGVKPVPSIPE